MKLFEGPKSNVLTKYILIILVLEEITRTIGTVNQDLGIKKKKICSQIVPLDFNPNGPIRGPVLSPLHKLLSVADNAWVELGCTSCTPTMSVTSQWG